MAEKRSRDEDYPSLPVTMEGICTKEKPIMKKSKKARPFDFSKHRQRHIALRVLYLGWDYSGMAAQDQIDTTIEAHLFAALLKTCLVESRDKCQYQRCGRTDKGVSAFGQVVSLYVRSATKADSTDGSDNEMVTSELPYVRMLNGVLPSNIRVIAWAPAPSGFNARFSCTSRTYKYYFRAGCLDIEAMKEAGHRFVGEHDFRNLCKMDVTNGVISYVRTVNHVAIGPCNADAAPGQAARAIYEITVVGRGFLWHQVRCMVAILFLIGQGLELPETVDCLLDTTQYPNRPFYNMAPELPLCLFGSDYDNLEWVYLPDSHQRLVSHLEGLWEEWALKATMVKKMLDSLADADCAQVPKESLKDFVDNDKGKGRYQPVLERHCCDNFEERLAKAKANRLGQRRRKS